MGTSILATHTALSLSSPDPPTTRQLYNVTADDILYCTLPLYHSAGGNIGIGLSWYTGTMNPNPMTVHCNPLSWYTGTMNPNPMTVHCNPLSWYTGAPLVLRSKFSASRFWVDCVEATHLF